MAAVDQERAWREYETQHENVMQLQEQLSDLVQQPRAGAGAESSPVPADMNDEDLEQHLLRAGEEQTELTLELERQRASLMRGASHIPGGCGAAGAPRRAGRPYRKA